MKYKVLKEETLNYEKKTLYRIQALENFKVESSGITDTIEQGDLGGWVEHENNLSQDGNCWIYDLGIVIGKSEIKDNAVVEEAVIIDSTVSDSVTISEEAYVLNCIISGNTEVYDGEWVDFTIHNNMTEVIVSEDKYNDGHYTDDYKTTLDIKDIDRT